MFFSFFQRGLPPGGSVPFVSPPHFFVPRFAISFHWTVQISFLFDGQFMNTILEILIYCMSFRDSNLGDLMKLYELFQAIRVPCKAIESDKEGFQFAKIPAALKALSAQLYGLPLSEIRSMKSYARRTVIAMELNPPSFGFLESNPVRIRILFSFFLFVCLLLTKERTTDFG